MSAEKLDPIVCQSVAASSVLRRESVASLWSGFGDVVRFHLAGADLRSVIVKWVHPPPPDHPNRRGWSGDIAHQRKLRSYEVEHAWYSSWAEQLSGHCRIAKCFGVERLDDGWVFVFEDLGASGFEDLRGEVTTAQVHACLRWLATLHSRFLGQSPTGLWPVGTYWHLATRPHELDAMTDGPLKVAAGAIDQKLNQARWQTIVHGDAKVANLMINRAGEIAAVDFQYVGGGCGIKDVAYFLGSCFFDEELERIESELLDVYFRELAGSSGGSLAQEVESEWRELYPWAWADFHRFLRGWSPSHPKLTSYSERMVSRVLAGIEG